MSPYPLADKSLQYQIIAKLCSSQPDTPVSVVPSSDAPPMIRGRAARPVTPKGITVKNPNAYIRCGGKITLLPSTLRIVVGEIWLMEFSGREPAHFKGAFK